MTPGASDALLVLDDDPTGAQTLSDAHVLLEWEAADLRAAPRTPSVHLLTNTRALDATTARGVVRQAVRTCRQARSGARVVLRGDSTLRGHLLEEYLGCCDGLGWPNSVPLLLVPALPSAGRVTMGGVQLLEQNGARRPVADSEFAADPVFGYRASRLLEWAAERSLGFFDASLGGEIPLATLRREGPLAVARLLAAMSRRGAPCVCVPDAETPADLELIAGGLRLADDDGHRIAVRCAPAFVGALAGNTARRLTAMPAGRTLVVCGSWVPSSGEQLRRLRSVPDVEVIEADVRSLASGDGGVAEALARQVDGVLGRAGVAVLATERARPEQLRTLEAGERIAAGLAAVVRTLKERPDVVIAKGGVTSAVVLRLGLGARSAHVDGPVAPGVSRWTAHAAGGDVPYLVVPGNVGGPELLAELVVATGHTRQAIRC